MSKGWSVSLARLLPAGISDQFPIVSNIGVKKSNSKKINFKLFAYGVSTLSSFLLWKRYSVQLRKFLQHFNESQKLKQLLIKKKSKLLKAKLRMLNEKRKDK